MVSPTTYALSPRCISLIAKAFAASPLLPAPVTNTLFADTIISKKSSMSSATRYSSAS